jgi:hypothetical protein
MCYSYGNSYCVFFILICSCYKVPSLQQVVHHWQVDNLFKFIRVHLHYECGFHNQIWWIEWKNLAKLMSEFKEFCDLPSIHSAKYNSNPYPKTLRSFYQWLFFLQLKSLQHAITIYGWLSEEILKCFCWIT